MGALDGIKDTYYQWEDGYYRFLDSLDAKGIPVYAIIDPIDKVVPSFALFLVLAVLLLLLLVWWIVQTFLIVKVLLIVKVIDVQESPLPGVAVQVKIGEQTFSGQTNAEGKTTAFKIPKGAEATILIDRTGFAHYEKKLTVNTEHTETVVLLASGEPGPPGAGVQRKIRILDESGQLVTSSVTLSFSCLNSGVSITPSSAVVNNGEYTVTEPPNCNGLIARVVAANYRTIDSQPIVNNPQAIYLSLIGGTTEERGNLEVRVLENGELATDDITVVLYDSQGGIPITQAETSNGTAVFQNVEAGTYTVRTVATTKYGSVSKSNVVIVNEETTTIDLTVVQDVMGSIKIKVVRKGTQTVIENATVALQSNNVEIGRLLTTQDNNGYVTFFVSEDKAYTAIVDADGYCLATRTELRLHPESYVIELDPFTAACGGSLIVKVIDQDGKAVRNASVALANEEKAFIGTGQKLADLNGEATFDGIPVGTYAAFAFKGTISGWSDAAFFNKKKDANKSIDLTVTMIIPDGTLRLKIVDKDGKAIEFPTVFLMDTFTNQVIGGGGMPANGEGVLEWTTRADKKMFAIIEKQGFATFVSTEFSLVPNGIQEKTITLLPAITKFEVELLGLYQGNLSAPPSPNATASLVNGQEYVAKFLVKIPEENFRESGKKPSELGLHIRTGDDAIMEKDLLFLKQSNIPRATVMRSTSYTGDFAVDSKAITNGDAKWLNAVWTNAFGSVIEADVVVAVKPSAAVGKKLNVRYRGWMKVSGTATRDPIDQSGATNELYSDTKTTGYLVGTGTLCDERFCFETSVRDPETELTHALENNSFGAKIKRDYTLTFSLANISKRSIDSFKNAELRFENPEESILLKNYTIFDADPSGSKPISGNANAFELPRIPIGDLSPTRQFSGTINFFTEKGKNGTFVFRIVDKDRGEVVFEREITILVAAEKQLALDYEPKQLLAGIENKVTFTATNSETGEPVSDATISIRDRFDSLLISSVPGKTNSLGKLQLTLPGQAPGEKLFAIAEKPDYNSAIVELSVDSALAKVEPKRLGFSLNPKTKLQDLQVITIKNLASFPLIIHKLELEGKWYGLIDEEAAANALHAFEGREIAAGKDLEIPVSIMLSPNANQLTQTADLNGQLNVELTNFGLIWPYAVEMGATIGLGGEADDSTCFTISRTEWKTSTEGKPVSIRFEIQNNCSVNGKPVALQEIEAKVGWQSNSLGNFNLVSSKSSSMLRSGYFKTILPTLDAEGSEVVDLTFTPSGAVDGQAKALILFQATNPADTQPQILKAQLDATIDIVNLLDCVSFSKEELGMTSEMVFASQTTGFGQLYNKELFEGSFEDTDYSSQMGALAQFGGSGFGSSPFYNNGAYSGYNPSNFNYGTQPGFSPALGGTGFSGTTPTGTSGSSGTAPVQGRQILGAPYPGLPPTATRAPPQDSFTISAKGCGGSVTIELDSELKLSTKRVQLQADETSSPIIVEGQENFPGQYGIKVSIQGAGAKTSRQFFTIPIVIRSNPFDCIQLNKFEFNIFKGNENQGIDTARVFNYCFDKPVPVLIDKHSLDEALKAGQKSAAIGLMMGLLSQVMNGDLLQKAEKLKEEKESGGNGGETTSECGALPKGAKCLSIQPIKNKAGQISSKPVFTYSGASYYKDNSDNWIEVQKNDKGQYEDVSGNSVTPPAPPEQPGNAGQVLANQDVWIGKAPNGQQMKANVKQVGDKYYVTVGGQDVEVCKFIEKQSNKEQFTSDCTWANSSPNMIPLPPITGLQFMYPMPFAQGSQAIERTGNPAIDKKREKDAEELASLQMIPVLMSSIGGGRDPFSMAFMMYAMGSLQAYQSQEDLRILTVQPDIELGQGIGGFGFLLNIVSGGTGGLGGQLGNLASLIGGQLNSQVPNRNAFSLLQIPAVMETQKFEGVSVAEYRRPTLDPRRDNQLLSMETAYIKIQNDDGVVQKDKLNPLYAVLNVNGTRHKYDQDQAYKREIPSKLREKGTTPINARFHLQFNSFRPDENAGQFSNELDNCTLGALRGSTGKEAVPRVKFSWSWDAIPMDACEESNGNYFYCDSTQFSISLLKKLELLREFTVKNADKFECPELVSGERPVEQTLSPLSKDIALTKLDKKRKGADINFLTTIESNNRKELTTSIRTEIRGINADGTPGDIIKACDVPAKVLTSTVAGCVASNLPNGAYLVTSSFGTITGCPECENGETNNDAIFKNMTIGLDQTITQCEPFNTKRLKDFVEATEKAGKTLSWPSGLDKEKTLQLVNFEAHLIKDGYSNDFRSDFHEFALTKSFFQTPKTYSEQDGLGEYFSDPEKMEFDYYGAPNAPLSQPGVYKIMVDVNFEDKSFSWFKSGEPSAKIIVSMEKTRDAKPASPFYSLPFDGAIGTDNGRNGYGLNYELLTADKPVQINRSTDQLVRLNSIVGSNPAGMLKGRLEDSFVTLNNNERGKVLTIDLPTQELKLAPSLATPVILNATGTTGRHAFVYYTLESNGQPQTSLDHLAEWTGLGATCKDFLGNDMASYSSSPDNSGKDASCAIIGGNSDSAFGFEWCEKTKSGSVFLETIFYSAPKSNSVLREKAASNEATFISPSGNRSEVDLSGVSSIAYNSGGSPIATVQDVLDLVKEELVCISGFDNSQRTEFFWNPKPVLESIQKERDQALQECIAG